MKYFFITTLTPRELLTPLRSALFELYLKSLKNQTYKDWEVLLVGEEDKREGNFIYLKSASKSKSDKLKVAHHYLLEMQNKPDFIIRFDDDDIISPSVLEKASEIDFDCYADSFHSFYDITSGKTSQQKRNWLPNTVIHKFEHAMAEYGEEKIPLFMQDHSQAWHVYYSSKKIVYAPKLHPIYLRIISPTTITSKMDVLKLNNVSEFNKSAYSVYLKSFGNWSKFDTPDFKQYFDPLVKVWESFSNSKILIKKNFLDFFR
jgi:hypothetical protein